MIARKVIAAEVRAALLLCGSLPRLQRGMPPVERGDAERMTEGISRRLFKALTMLEPERARLVKRDVR